MEQAVDKALGLLGLARKAGKLQTGEESVGVMLTEKRARLTLLAEDAGEAVSRKARGLAEGTRQRVLKIPYDKLRLGAALGRPSVSVAAFGDVSMALAFVRALPEGTADPELLEDLERRVARVKAKRKKN
ncbi:MAG: ribosomal L7Ae/L30e/S12e/Gadd45 family protein [Oscillospiraceae bacterium]|nr:ribosomal L7Ae/L30e/S12e/Gadd45 family protein [Oscillospiraceae bacterium]MBR7010197.1 ribosomal L7Ae/L30e/S12e/Gadd45 family protein [Oscillospiraceae bacterium]